MRNLIEKLQNKFAVEPVKRQRHFQDNVNPPPLQFTPGDHNDTPIAISSSSGGEFILFSSAFSCRVFQKKFKTAIKQIKFLESTLSGKDDPPNGQSSSSNSKRARGKLPKEKQYERRPRYHRTRATVKLPAIEVLRVPSPPPR